VEMRSILSSCRCARFACIALGCVFITLSARGQVHSDMQRMSLIPPGKFWMGRTHFFLVDAVGWFERDKQDDFPAHLVDQDAFLMDKYEVTNEEYARFLAAKDGRVPWHWPKGQIPKNEERFPVYNIDWAEASAYCGWVGKRLPSESEWEKAARGGLDRAKFVWGEFFTPAPESTGQPAAAAARRSRPQPPANFDSNGAIEVGKYSPNGFGLYDMAGNVWEWTNDWYERNYYSRSPLKNPSGPSTGAYKVFRGGGWNDSEERNLMPSFRNYTDARERSITIGFRCAQSAN
jgi:sulfatase modifying factor 1